ncbi:gamma-glutamyl-gamma-aminobutyrate hydrolase family protein [Myxococcota bacterium]|nr:gamma-glutamyl-gamma-aminobutyrate hydrolase family protein [Myxococcota bacterium]
MPRLLVLQHVPYEILGTFDPLLKRSGFRIRYVNFGRRPESSPTLDGYHGLVILGGPMGVAESDLFPHLEVEMELIREAIDREIPTLGICLGAQLIARALGASVTRSPVPEIGWHDVSITDAGAGDPLFAHFRATEKVFQWHQDAFEVPAGAIRLVSSAGCPHQAFRYGERVYGFQFHMEVDERLIERWLAVPLYRQQMRASGGDANPERIRSDTGLYLSDLSRLSRSTFREFIELFN